MAKKPINIKSPKPIKITLDKERNFLLDMNAYIELEEYYPEKSIQEILDDFLAGRTKAIRDVLWAGIVHEDPDLTPKEVGAMISPGYMNELSDQIINGIYTSLPESGEEKN